jgi:phage terminase large subunit-like protein
MFGHRLGSDPRSMLTMTPRPLDWLRKIEAEARTFVTTGATYDNLTNLAESFIDMVLGRYEGTRLGRQELHALYLDDVEGALWAMATIEVTRLARFDPTDPWQSLRVEAARARTLLGLGLDPIRDERTPWHILVGVDPPGETAECGIIVGAAPVNGKASRHHAVILDDLSLAGPPEVWGAQVVAAVHKHGAERVVVEANQGGDMVRSTIHNVDPDVTVTKVRASQSKYDRAEPVSVLYAKGWVHHAGWFGELETQLSTWVPTESKSPDRLDALVHLVNGLLAPMPNVRATATSPAGRRIA